MPHLSNGSTGSVPTRQTSSQRRLHWLWWATAIVVTAALTWWAASATLVAPQASQVRAAPTVVTVADTTIGSTLAVGVSLLQPVVVQSTNLLPGVVTAVSSQPTISEGEAAYAVAGVPVIVVAGEQPFFRDLADGAQGGDVTVLQHALTRLGYLHDAVDGRFGNATRLAVRAFQRATGQPADGVVRLGQLVAVPQLPMPLRLGPALRVGAVLGQSEDGLLGPSGKRAFQLVLSPDRFAQIPTDASFLVHFKSLTWKAIASDTTIDQNQNAVITLVGEGGGEVCGSHCADLPAAEKLTLRGEAVLAPAVSGPGVAAAAIRTNSDGRTYVSMASGQRRSVVVKASQGGVAVVDGLRAGDRVALPDGATSDLIHNTRPTPSPSSS